MIITKIGITNKINNLSLENKEKNLHAQINSDSDKISFGMDPMAAAILQEATIGTARGLLGIRKIKQAIEKADELFDRYDVKPAIELAVQMDKKLGDKLLYFEATESLLVKAIKHVSNLSDEHLVNRDLKQKVLDYCFLDNGVSYYHPDNMETEGHKLAENLFIRLDNKYFHNYKKFIIEKRDKSNRLDIFKDIDSVLKGIDDMKFRDTIKNNWLKSVEKNKEPKPYVRVFTITE